MWVGLLVGSLWPSHCWAATSGTFSNPFIANGADPWVIFKDGFYYYTQTTGTSVRVRKSATITGLASASAMTVFTPSAPNNQEVWAPELHFLRGKWYIYFAADDGNNANHRLYVAEANTANAQGAYTLKGRIFDPSNDRWAIDGTVLEADNGALYFIWSGWPSTANVVQNIYIAPMSDPWTISGPRVLLSTPTLDWETQPDTSAPLINEGPEVLKRDGKTFIIYSANKAWQDWYCLGGLVNTNGDFLNPSAWTKYPQPFFVGFTDETGEVIAPGHCSFTRTPWQTEDWILYHAAKYSGAGFDRSVRAQSFTWNADGTPLFARPIGTNLPVILPAGETALPAVPNVTNGMLRLETFAGIGGSTIAALTNHVKFPDHPDLVRYVGQFEMPTNIGDNHGARFSGYLIPPTTANYIFYVCSDDQGALYLSTNSNPANKRLIAYEPQWNGSRHWTNTTRRPAQENISAPIALQAGQSYYIEALAKEGVGSDNFAVAFRRTIDPIPSNGSPPIAGSNLAVGSDLAAIPVPVITQNPTNRSAYLAGRSAFAISTFSAGEVRYQWQREVQSNDWRNIVGGYSNVFAFTNVTTNDAGNYRVVAQNVGALTGSPPVTLRVLDWPRLTGPTNFPDGKFRFSFTGEPGFNYQILATTNLLTWETIATLSGVNGPTNFIDVNASSRANRSYRLQIPQ